VKESGIDPWMVVPHGSYLLNCGSSDDEVLHKTREALVDELKRCEKLGLPIYNFHPGLSSNKLIPYIETTNNKLCKLSSNCNFYLLILTFWQPLL